MEIKELTRAEEEIMQLLWKLGKAFVKDILEQLPIPKPAYNTVSTIVRILEQKDLVGFQAFGKTHQYFPKISQEEYRNYVTNKVKMNYFDNSASAMMSYFVEKEDLNVKELDEIMKMLEDLKNKK